jgi:steroid delta-isomerase-like uncharacterized protein
LCANDCEGEDVGEPTVLRGLAALRSSWERYLAAFPDLRMQPGQIVADEHQAAVAWTATGTHRGGLMHIPPTGRGVTIQGALFITVQAGKISRLRTVWDAAGLLRALGLLPDL